MNIYKRSCSISEVYLPSVSTSVNLHRVVAFLRTLCAAVALIGAPHFPLLRARAKVPFNMADSTVSLEDLPGELILIVFGRLRQSDIFARVRRVCKAWRSLTFDPLLCAPAPYLSGQRGLR